MAARVSVAGAAERCDSAPGCAVRSVGSAGLCAGRAASGMESGACPPPSSPVVPARPAHERRQRRPRPHGQRRARPDRRQLAARSGLLRRLSAPTSVGLSLLHWINDGLMAVFFLLVGLEIKRELLDGQLRTWPDRTLPGIAALGGMLLPALVYVAVNWSLADHHAGLGDPGRDRHRLRARRAGALRLARARVPEGVPDGARDPRRPRRHPDHRGVLHGATRPVLPCFAARP